MSGQTVQLDMHVCPSLNVTVSGETDHAPAKDLCAIRRLCFNTCSDAKALICPGQTLPPGAKRGVRDVVKERIGHRRWELSDAIWPCSGFTWIYLGGNWDAAEHFGSNQ